MNTPLELAVAAIRSVARDVVQVTLRAKDGRPLPGAAPGAHVDLALPNGLSRQYSLVNALGDGTQEDYVVAVGWDAASRGGSRWIHEKLRVGQALKVGAPRNLFAMEPAHRKVLLVAGGIGITPIYAMARRCEREGLDWELVACARSAARLAYLEELKALAGQRLRLHFDDEQGGPLDVAGLLRERRWDAVYACGPAPMLDAIGAATAHWPEGSARMERFKAAPVEEGERRAFELVLARSACSTTVAAEESVADALDRLGVPHPTACREGLCGTCEATVLEGSVQHLDSVLDAAQRAAGTRIITCVSRCGGERLVLDL